MEWRQFDQRLHNFGFRLQYNRLYKPEYLPGRVRYNQFVVLAIVGVWLGTYSTKVSNPNRKLVSSTNFNLAPLSPIWSTVLELH